MIEEKTYYYIKKCIVCGKPACIYSGHVKTNIDGIAVIAGFCSDECYRSLESSSELDDFGCFGMYSPEMGASKVKMYMKT